MTRPGFVILALAFGFVTAASAQTLTAQQRTACKADFEKYCQGTTPGGGRIVALDYSFDELTSVRDLFWAMGEAGEIGTGGGASGAVDADLEDEPTWQHSTVSTSQEARSSRNVRTEVDTPLTRGKYTSETKRTRTRRATSRALRASLR